MTAPIANGEAGSSVRTKLNTTIAKADTAETDIVDLQAADNRRAFAGGVAWDGASGYANAPTDNSFIGNDFTISVIITPLELGGFGALWGRQSTTTGNPAIICYISPTGEIWFNSAGGSSWEIQTTKTLDEGKSYFVTFTKSGAGLLDIYIDGNLEASYDDSATDYDSIATEISSSLAFGARRIDNSFDAYLNGSLRDVSIFNRALSAAEALEISEIGIESWLAKYPEDQWGDSGSEDFEDGTSTLLTTTFALPDYTTLFNNYGSTHSNYDHVADADSIGSAYSGDRSNKIISAAGNWLFRCTINEESTYLIEFAYYNPTGNADLGAQGSSTMAEAPVLISGSLSVKDAWEKVVFRAKRGVGNSGHPLFKVGASETIYIDDVKVTKLGVKAAYPFNEGIGRQARDLSGRYDALFSATGYQHLKPKTEGYVRVKGADANPSIMMLEDSDIIPADAVWTQIIAEERIVDIANTAQDLNDRRVRLADSTGDLIIQRSDGSNHATLGTATAPTDTDDVDVEVHYKQVIR